MTGTALRYAQKKFNNKKWGNRKRVRDLLFIFTDGRVDESNRQEMIDAAEEMRDKNVEVSVSTVHAVKLKAIRPLELIKRNSTHIDLSLKFRLERLESEQTKNSKKKWPK